MNALEFLHSTSLSLTDWNIDTLINLAHTQGQAFTADDLETAADELWGQLREDQLRDIVGGGSTVVPGPVTVDLSVTATAKSGGAWSPPPGDVSGNSCFFTRR